MISSERNSGSKKVFGLSGLSPNGQYRGYLLLFLLVIFRGNAQCQSSTILFQRLTLQQGLATNFTTSITQDTLGFIWLGTVNGLTRFDGQRCVTFAHQPGNPYSLSNRLVRSIFRAQKGTLWIGTQNGLNRFLPETQRFQHYSFASLGAGCNLIRHAAESPDGRLWFATSGGVVVFNPATAKAKLLVIPSDSASHQAANSIRRVLMDGTTLWIATQSGLYAYNRQNRQFKSFRHNVSIATSLPYDYVSALTLNPQTKEILLGTRMGHVAVLDPASGQFRQLPLDATNQEIGSLLYTRTGTLWVGVTGRGLFRYDSATRRFSSYTNNETNPRSLVSNSVKALFEDNSGVIWVTTDDAGVSWFNPTVSKINSLFDDVGYRPTSTLGLDACGLSFDQKNCLWVATRDGIVWINPKTQTYRLYRHDTKNAASLHNNFTYSILADSQGAVWIGSPTGLDKLNPTTGQVEQILCLPLPEHPGIYPEFNSDRHNFVAGSQVFSVVEGPDKRLYFGTNEKLTVYDPQTHLFFNRFNDERIRKLPGKNYNTLCFDRHNNLWVGGLGPVYKISPDLTLLAEYTHQEDNPNSLPDDGVTDFVEDRHNRIWMSTDNGLACLNQHTQHFTIYTTRHGLPNNDIAALRLVGDTLWVSTSRGIVSVDTRRLAFTVFDESDGSPSAEFESGAMAFNSTGRLYFGAMRGLVYLEPKHIQLNSFVPPVYISSFRTVDRVWLSGPLANPPSLVLGPAQNAFSFEMAALSFDHSSGNQYAYRLENFEEQWNQTNDRPFASYTNVPPGSYVLHVIASNNDGVWNREGYRLAITIQAPFWQTWWFRLIALTTLLTIAVTLARWREKRVASEQQEKSELRERIAASEMKALRSQMNPHFLYNSLNAIRLFILQNDSDNADKYLVKFARLMRLILDNSRQEWVTLSSELEQLQLYLELEQLRFNHKFDFTLGIDPALSPEKLSIPPMIIQPYIENAILHGMAHKKTGGTITVAIYPKNDHLECIIDDDGVGRQKAQELKSRTVSSHKSVGLKVTEERLQLITQRTGKESGVVVIDKTTDQQEPAGTRVIVQLPALDGQNE
ncbi:two-component regulator propeller domain-containing protein [Spirosoma sp. SC4-14]|uniref:ligand-binding sensor domain-containing protein n=1 Tax=Spirosoma sp. SC4-14 TaxID=3128900 RepID=UPI0030CB4EC8